MTTISTNSNVGLDDHVESELKAYVDLDKPKSFFMYAGAGSGKTKSLVEILKHTRKSFGRQLTLKGQMIAVITYTNAARDEITSRIDFSPLFHVSTIHSFSWDMIKGFSGDIRTWLRSNLREEISKLEEEEARGRLGTKASITRQAQIDSKRRRLERLQSFKAFTYSPNGDNREVNALNHAEVISICSYFLASKPLMRAILVGKYPYILIDESQDTNKHLVDALFGVQAENSDLFGLGLIGDVMQRIYADGKVRIEESLPSNWAKPAKKLNHRCPKRVVKLINAIRVSGDEDGSNKTVHQQEARTDSIEGHARFFLGNPNVEEKQSFEDNVRQTMAEITGDALWNDRLSCKILTLEHHMSASRLGFIDLMQPLYEQDSWRTGLLEGTLPFLRLFTDSVLPVIDAVERSDKFSVAKIVRSRSPLLSPDALKNSPDPISLLKDVQAAVQKLSNLWVSGQPSCGAVLDVVEATGLFSIPEILKPLIALRKSKQTPEMKEADKDDPVTEETRALIAFLGVPFDQVRSYHQYVNGTASFDTHQGVKGREFDRVMVIADDSEARGFMFGYDKLFGAKDYSAADLKNLREGRETGIDRTRRLFYVTCSRAKKSLCIVNYTSDPSAVRDFIISQGWFSSDEILA